VCRRAQKTAYGAVSDHESGSFCRGRWQTGAARHLDGRDVPQVMTRCPTCPIWKFEGNLERPGRVFEIDEHLGDDRDRARLGDAGSTIGSSWDSRKRVTHLGQVQTISTPSAGRTKAQGRMTGCSGTATWSSATDPITDQDPEVERVHGAAPSAKWATKEQSGVGHGGWCGDVNPKRREGTASGQATSVVGSERHCAWKTGRKAWELKSERSLSASSRRRPEDGPQGSVVLQRLPMTTSAVVWHGRDGGRNFEG
jgi:hypothetical protein